MKSFLRWLAILPAVVMILFVTFLAAGFSDFIFHLLGRDRSGRGVPETDISFMPFIFAGLGGFAIVWVAQAIAPSFKRGASLTVAFLMGAFFLVALFFEIAWMNRFVDLAFLIGIGIAGYKAYNHETLLMD